MAVARVDPGELDAGAIGFRLAPRINAAGRLHRADAGLELVLTEDPERARAVAAELDAVNAERRDVETRIRFEAEALVGELGPSPAYVLAGEGWHPGVIGIVAARIAERHHRPAVLIALDGDEGTGSGRSIPGFDLLGGLNAASHHLLRHGGHRAAAGLTIARESVDGFREAFCAHAAEVLTPDDLVPKVRVDAVAPGDALDARPGRGARVARAVRPGQPGARAARARRAVLRPARDGGGAPRRVHAARGRRPLALRALRRRQPAPAEPGSPVDAAVRLEVNRFNGTVEPRLVLRQAVPASAAGDRGPRRARLRRGGDRRARPRPGALELPAVGPAASAMDAAAEHVRDLRGTGIAGLLADLVATGERVLAVTGAPGAPRAGAARPRRRVRRLLVGRPRRRSRPGRRLRASRGHRPAAARPPARGARTSVRGRLGAPGMGGA